MYAAARRWVYQLFSPGEGGRVGNVTDWFIMTLIGLNVIAVILETVEAIAATAGEFFWWFEAFSVTVFTIEYLGRVWSAIENDEYQGIIFGRIKFASKFLMIVDLLAILPFYLMLFGVQADLRYLRALRVIRVFRLLKLARYNQAMQSFSAVFHDKKEKLLIALFANGILLIIAASAMYFVEHPHQPDIFSSIPAAFYWAMITLTTVGYGDVTPLTYTGQILTGVIALLGIGLFALPASILASGFMEQTEESERAEWGYCPYCGEEIPHSR